MIIRGTTPKLEFILPFNADQLESIFVTLVQSDGVVIEKVKKDIICEGNKISFRMTQSDTLKLKAEETVEIQIRAKTVDGEAIASCIINERASRILKDGEI